MYSECSGQPSEVGNDQVRAIIETDPLPTTREVAEELSINHCMISRHLKQIGKVKKLNKWMPHDLTENQKKFVILKCYSLLFYATTTNHLSIRL